MLTFFLYLSDVEEGGETYFPTLDIAVKPKKGRAVLWPSTLVEFPTQIDPRTMHEARKVIKGRKFAANSWIHVYDYRKPNLWGCTGTFDET
jgi:prolyl 4-hydroxylase